MTVRPATADDLTGVLGVLDSAALETEADRVRASVDRGDAFVAVREETETSAEGAVLGAIVLVRPADTDGSDAAHVDAVAVRRRRRGQGIGRALVSAAAGRYDRLVAEFGAGVRPFYESLGFEIEPLDGERDRYRGVSDGPISLDDD
ncbi:GNAT family N-acetyltransferase [Halosimplex rubrum]|uniref:GNAT family N-acetyltransferase n=1 Tax=Halosimplex rubrum TaxID=869889 RepID=A0A7D5T0W4_9EURY|nr:GNAT family N-acetyltransferase [Halosimplex rubrum]